MFPDQTTSFTVFCLETYITIYFVMHTNDIHTLIFFKVGRCGVDTNRRKNEVGKRNRALSRLPFNTCKAHTIRN